MIERSFAQKGREGPWKKDGIKAMALCPWFANTKLVTTSTSIENLENTFKRKGEGTPLQLRVMEISEVLFLHHAIRNNNLQNFFEKNVFQNISKWWH